jgi:molybdopterin-guanine dinucleotide biosynthesis protein A
MPDTGLAAAILMGGRARRLDGAIKAALTIGGMRIVDRQLAALRRVADPIFVVSSPDGPSEGDLDVVRDAFPDHGALGGIYTAITASPHDRTLVVACDLPFLNADLIAYMAGLDADLVIPRSARGYEPLMAVYSRRCAASIRERLARGSLAASVLPEGVRIAEVGPEVLKEYDREDLLFVNVNTPHDYARANKLVETLAKPCSDRIMDELGR